MNLTDISHNFVHHAHIAGILVFSVRKVGNGSRIGPHPPRTPRHPKGHMIIGIGIDLIECSRVERELSERQCREGESVFTAEEVRLCGEGKRRAALMSACLAAKEAALKALGAEVEDLGVFREVELLFGPTGTPRVVLHSRLRAKAQSLGVIRIWVSIASAKKHAGASVVMES